MKKEIFKNKGSLQKAIDGFFDNTSDVSRVINERTIWRNLLYYCGEQYLEFLVSSGSFRRRNVSQFVPTPVSNEIREYVRSIKALLLGQNLVPRVWPNTEEKEDEMAAELGENVLVWMDNANDAIFFDELEKVVIWLCLSGTSFMRAFPDADGGKWIIDEKEGAWKTGEVACDSIMPFNVRFEKTGDRLDLKSWVGIQSLKPREWVEDTFRAKINRSDNDSLVVNYQKKLEGLVSSVSQWKGRAFDPSAMAEDDDMVIFREVEFKPQPGFPNGKYVISCGGTVIKEYDRLPIRSAPGEWCYSITDFHFNYVPGRFWSDAPVSDLISPQNIINEIDQTLIINRKGIGRPRILSPGEIGLKKMDIGGHGFLALKYNPIMGQKPEIREGVALPVQVLEERRLQKEQLQDMGGDPKNVLRGKQPSANASGVLTQELRETALQGKSPDIDRFNRARTRVYKKRLLVAQEIYTEERLIKVGGRGKKVKIIKFKASDLRGNTDVRLELDSGLLTTKSGQAQMMLNMIQAGFFKEGPDAPDSETKQEVMQRMGMTTFTDKVNTDSERAELENALVASGKGEVMTAIENPQTGEMEVVTDDPLFKYDNHKAHFECHRKFIISPEFQEVPVHHQAMLLHHTDLHQKQIEEAPPDIRDYVQVDKLLASGVLTASERAQVLDKYLGIKPGNEPMTGLPSADTVTKAKQKMIDTDKKELGKEKAGQRDFLKHVISEGAKLEAIANKPEQRNNGNAE